MEVFTSDWAMELFKHVPVLMLRTLITFLVVLFVVRWTGKRSIANLAPFDLAMVILIGEVAAIPVAELRVDLLHGILPVILLGGLHVGTTTIAVHSKWFERFTEGTPTLLVKDGKVLRKNLLKERVSMADLMTALRHKEVTRVSEVQQAWIEHAGGVSVIRRHDVDAATPVDLKKAIEEIVSANSARMRQELEELLHRKPESDSQGGR
ncbi:MAG TPA: YetF domain-containing protein [Symbiobacteriaceae bacterium]|nr:YetF domain-containing protein [Symbiobacteriaceae bacterium]